MKDLRNIPQLLSGNEPWEQRRLELRKQYAETFYGVMPETGFETGYEVQKARHTALGDVSCTVSAGRLTVRGPVGEHSFPLHLCVPDTPGKKPIMLYLAIDGVPLGWDDPVTEPDGTLPFERHTCRVPVPAMMERGMALAVCFADDIEPDRAESFPSGLASAFFQERGPRDMGCLGTWAFGMRRALEVLRGFDWADISRMMVSGCSRCGKTALWCGVNEESVACTVSFESGCGGAALDRGKRDERVTRMMRTFPHWLCLNALQWSENEEAMPYDQHMLLGLLAPRRLFVTSSSRDAFSDPYAEFLGAWYAGEAYREYGFAGLDTCIQPPVGEVLCGERVGYYLRDGEHGLETEEWDALFAFLRQEGILN